MVFERILLSASFFMLTIGGSAFLSEFFQLPWWTSCLAIGGAGIAAAFATIGFWNTVDRRPLPEELSQKLEAAQHRFLLANSGSAESPETDHGPAGGSRK
ncbi:hypothetical protein [Rhodococcus sp. 1139]|uniref:hypothetical protein n=1 Tax=Rhodococcus sp. 1139 TaxID=1833762 RepID=UPI000871F4DC|nr:hypothetical protein [Rhodococcus sp. 1139]OFE10476.1 hypothetical protein A5N83_02360 [Rhodococcus sp. 1139]